MRARCSRVYSVMACARCSDSCHRARHSKTVKSHLCYGLSQRPVSPHAVNGGEEMSLCEWTTPALPRPELGGYQLRRLHNNVNKAKIAKPYCDSLVFRGDAWLVSTSTNCKRERRNHAKELHVGDGTRGQRECSALRGVHFPKKKGFSLRFLLLFTTIQSNPDCAVRVASRPSLGLPSVLS